MVTESIERKGLNWTEHATADHHQVSICCYLGQTLSRQPLPLSSWCSWILTTEAESFGQIHPKKGQLDKPRKLPGPSTSCVYWHRVQAWLRLRTTPQPCRLAPGKSWLWCDSCLMLTITISVLCTPLSASPQKNARVSPLPTPASPANTYYSPGRTTGAANPWTALCPAGNFL